jgi:murein DD-endopeptidase MepM/ murein hydrolase activator NlpD
LKREIPQKVNARFGFTDQNSSASVGRLCSALFRRTRSASLLGVTLTAGTFGSLCVLQKAEALPSQAPSLLGSLSSLPASFNSADALAKGNSSVYLEEIQADSQDKAIVPQINVDESTQSTAVFQSDEALSTSLSLQPSSSTVTGLGLSNAVVDSTQPANASLQSALQSVDSGHTGLVSPVASNDGANQNAILSVESTGAFVHTVKMGENLTEIAQKYSVSPEIIAQTNRIPDPNHIDVHEDLVIPAVSLSAVVAPPLMMGALAGNTGAVLQAAESQGVATELLKPQDSIQEAKSLPPTLQAIQPVDMESGQVINTPSAGQPELIRPSGANAIALNNVSAQGEDLKLQQLPESAMARRVAFPQFPSLDLPALVSAEQFLPSTFQNDLKKYIWPARGVFTSGYGWRWGRMHRGIDIAGPVGTPVVSAAAGVVISAGWNDGGYGNLVEIRHNDGSVTVYAHNNRIVTNTGAVVGQGELIAQMGSTGRSTGPHSHFEIRPRGSRAVDPLFFLGRS